MASVHSNLSTLARTQAACHVGSSFVSVAMALTEAFVPQLCEKGGAATGTEEREGQRGGRECDEWHPTATKNSSAGSRHSRFSTMPRRDGAAAARWPKSFSHRAAPGGRGGWSPKHPPESPRSLLAQQGLGEEWKREWERWKEKGKRKKRGRTTVWMGGQIVVDLRMRTRGPDFHHFVLEFPPLPEHKRAVSTRCVLFRWNERASCGHNNVEETTITQRPRGQPRRKWWRHGAPAKWESQNGSSSFIFFGAWSSGYRKSVWGASKSTESEKIPVFVCAVFFPSVQQDPGIDPCSRKECRSLIRLGVVLKVTCGCWRESIERRHKGRPNKPRRKSLETVDRGSSLLGARTPRRLNSGARCINAAKTPSSTWSWSSRSSSPSDGLSSEYFHGLVVDAACLRSHHVLLQEILAFVDLHCFDQELSSSCSSLLPSGQTPRSRLLPVLHVSRDTSIPDLFSPSAMSVVLQAASRRGGETGRCLGSAWRQGPTLDFPLHATHFGDRQLCFTP